MILNQPVKYTTINDPLSMIFAALADPTRRAILADLSQTDLTVNELAAPYDMSLPAISKHLKILEKAGLVSQTREAQFRPRHLEAQSLQEATEWLNQYRELWTNNFNNLDTYLSQIQSNNKEN